MRLANEKKGQMRVIEAILAAFIIIFALSFVNFFAVNPASQKYETTEMDKLGYNALHDLDVEGILSQIVYNHEWDDLRAALSVTLPIDVYFNMTVLNIDGSQINDDPISYGYPETFERSKVVSSVTYTLIGYPNGANPFEKISIYDPKVLVLQLVRG
jgi:hypothetical protein